MNYNNIIVYDFETSSTNPETTQILQVAALALDGRTLKPIDEGEFQSYCRPSREDEVEQGALDVNGLTLEFLRDKPLEKDVWNSFIHFCNKFTKGKTIWNKPVSAGFNHTNFDNIITKRACKEYGKSYPFHPRDSFDVMYLLSFCHENNPKYTKGSFDFARQYYGMPSEGAHNAIVDVKQTAEMLVRKLRWMRKICEKTKFEGAFANNG